MTDFGKPVYNMLALPEQPHVSNRIPLGIYDASVKVLENAGLLGKHHVTEKGFWMEGFADGVEMKVTGIFEISYRRGQTQNAKEVAEGLRRKNDFRPRTAKESEQDLEETASEIAGTLAETDPLSLLLMEFYGELSMIRSQEIHTPAGLQKVHFHYGKSGLDSVRLFRPKSDAYWFDYDRVKKYLWERSEKLQKEIERWENSNPGETAAPPFWFERIITYAMAAISKKARSKANVWELHVKEELYSGLLRKLLQNSDLIKNLAKALDTGHSRVGYLKPIPGNSP
jgi:hypothetical protein